MLMKEFHSHFLCIKVSILSISMHNSMEFFLLLEMPKTGGFKLATLWTQVDQNIPSRG